MNSTLMEIERGGCRRRRRRVILFPLPFQGHIYPMLHLANILHTNGFLITILHTTFNAPNKSNYPHFTFKSVIDNQQNDPNFANLASKSAADHQLRLILMNQHGGDSLRDELERILSESSEKKEEEEIVCLITDALWHFAQSVADGFNLPRIVLQTTSLLCLLVYASIPLLDDRGFFKLGDADLEESVLEFPYLKAKDVLQIGVKSQKEPMSSIIDDMVKQTKASSGIIWNSFKELEEPELQTILHDFPVPNFLIGPLHKYFPPSFTSLLEQDRSVLPWLQHQPPNSVLYVSFGSAAQLAEKDFLEMAHGLANSKQSFLWVVRPGSVVGSEWLEALPNGFVELVGERGRIVKWAPQQEVLAHVAIGAFWTHSGWNSTLESISEGVPMICSPFFGDQPMDARHVSDVLKVGIYLENGFEREEIESAIRRVMVNEEGEDIRERARGLQEKANLSLKKGGSSYESLKSLVHYISSF